MNRLTRITATLVHLQSKKMVTAKEIADRFDVSLRTVYRDIKTLQDAGVPIGSENGVGYFLVEGYSLPPLMITPEEANALVVSEKLILNQGDASLVKDFNSFFLKIKAILKYQQKEHVANLENRVAYTFVKENATSAWLSLIQKAVSTNKIVAIEYHSISKDEITCREIKPLAVYFTNLAWIVIADCSIRKELREFRLDRILQAQLTQTSFDYPADFDLNQYFNQKYEM